MSLIGRLEKQDESRYILFPITLISASGEEMEVDALFDTGFSAGKLGLHADDVEQFGWPLKEKERPVSTASGKTRVRIYQGKARIDGVVVDLPVHVSNFPEGEVLLGMGLLENMNLTIDSASDVYRLDWK